MNTPRRPHRLPFVLLLLLCASPAQAAASLWQEINLQNRQSNLNSDPNSNPNAPQRFFKLDEPQLQVLVDQHQFQQRSASIPQPLTLSVPLPDGSDATLELSASTVLSNELKQQHTNLHTWRISSTHPQVVSGRAELTELGLHIMLRSKTGDQWLIEPEEAQLQPALRQYQSYSKRQRGEEHTFSCGATANTTQTLKWQRNIQRNPAINPQAYAQRNGSTLLSYDLAIAATSEYTAQFNGSQAAAYSNIVSTVNRINGIYERELGITLKLVSGTETVFSNAANDPFNTTSPFSLSYQNQGILDTLVGAIRYDVGHVLGASIGGTGEAAVASVCRNGSKAQGYSASSTPSSSGFMVDYVAHELGHQLGATHTFNSTHSSCGGGNRIAETAFEPGSGSTIMSYAGLCAADNIQRNADPQFHTGSIDQIYRLTHGGSAAHCATQISQNNQPPNVDAGKDYTIPARTPFTLSGLASDVDGDPLLFGWDQIDLGNTSGMGIDTTNNPLIKSNPLSSSGIRHIPDIPRLLSTAQHLSSGESLPRSNRTMNFRLSVRDGKGASSSDTVKLTVHDTGERFSISYPNTALNSGSHQITWNTAGTNQPPINCSQVDIAYTNDRGVSFTDITRNTPNDGAERIQLNNRVQHIRIKCSDNAFFALSGTAPHIASYRNDSSQSSNSQTDTNTNTNDGEASESGGGGSLPLNLGWLLFLAGMFTTFKGRSNLHKHTGNQFVLTVFKITLYSSCVKMMNQ